MKNSVYIATSLDGFIARENGEIDWLINAPNPNKEDFGYGEFIKSIDLILMGSGTFQTVEDFDSWPYPGIKTIVLSRTRKGSPKLKNEDIEFSKESPMELMKRLKESGFQNAYVDGGKVIQSFLENGLIDQMTITKIPVLIGSGRSLFGKLTKDISFHHRETHTFYNGFVQSTYVKRKDS